MPDHLKRFYIKQRHNPQLGTYYVACGRLSKREAKAKERSLFGDNTMLGFDTGEEYLEMLSSLRAAGEHVQ